MWPKQTFIDIILLPGPVLSSLVQWCCLLMRQFDYTAVSNPCCRLVNKFVLMAYLRAVLHRAHYGQT